MNEGIMRYDLGPQEVSTTHLPPEFRYLQSSVIMTMDHGGLGFVGAMEYKLNMWSRGVGPGEDEGFLLSRVSIFGR